MKKFFLITLLISSSAFANAPLYWMLFSEEKSDPACIDKVNKVLYSEIDCSSISLEEKVKLGVEYKKSRSENNRPRLICRDETYDKLFEEQVQKEAVLKNCVGYNIEVLDQDSRDKVLKMAGDANQSSNMGGLLLIGAALLVFGIARRKS